MDTGFMSEIVNGMREFGALIGNVWDTGAYGFGSGKLFGALIIFLLFALLRGLFTRFVLMTISRYTKRTKTKIDDELQDVLEDPIKFFFLIAGAFFAVKFLAPVGTAEVIADRILRSLIAVGLFWAVYTIITPLSLLLRQVEELLSKEIVNWLLMVVRISVVLTAAANIFQIWGIQIAPIIAGFGLFGVAVALGAQDLFKNLLGGVSILVEKRFAIGDRVRVDDIVHGQVEHIGFRSTRIRRFDKVVVTVPNNMFADRALINYSTMPHRRIQWLINLEYSTSVAQMKQICDNVLAWLKQNDEFVTDDENVACHVVIDQFGASSIDMLVHCFARTTAWADWLAVKQDLAFAIKHIVEEAGSGFAFPSRSIYMEFPSAAEDEEAPPDFVGETQGVGQSKARGTSRGEADSISQSEADSASQSGDDE